MCNPVRWGLAHIECKTPGEQTPPFFRLNTIKYNYLLSKINLFLKGISVISVKIFCKQINYCVFFTECIFLLYSCKFDVSNFASENKKKKII